MRFKDKTDLWKRHSDVPQPIKNAKRLFQVRGKFFTQSRTRSDFSTGGKSVLSNQERETIFFHKWEKCFVQSGAQNDFFHEWEKCFVQSGARNDFFHEWEVFCSIGTWNNLVNNSCYRKFNGNGFTIAFKCRTFDNGNVTWMFGQEFWFFRFFTCSCNWLEIFQKIKSKTDIPVFNGNLYGRTLVIGSRNSDPL